MFTIQNVPVAIEPGVGAIEAELLMPVAPSAAVKSRRSAKIPVQLFRLPMDAKNAENLPFVPSSKTPHVFSLAQDLKTTPLLVVFDSLGRITAIYNRDKTGKAWDRTHVAPEFAGATVTQFSVRFSFSSTRTRDAFMHAVDTVMDQIKNKEKPDEEEMLSVFRLLNRMRAQPVMLPVAVAKSHLQPVKL